MFFIKYCTKSEKHSACMGTHLENTDNTVHCRVWVIYPCDCVADWELQPAAAARHHKCIMPHIPTPGKDQNSK